MFGFIGPNGAGKSTTIRVLMNFLFATRGSASVLGLDVVEGSMEIRRRTGYLPGDLALYPTMTGREQLLYFANLRNVDAARRVEELADRFELDLDRTIREYSTGNRQKVGLVNAFMHDPELLILDEPTSGLDPLMQQEFQGLLAETRSAGRTVFLSSHILPEVDRVADRVGIVRESRLIAVDTLESFKARAQTTLTIEFEGPVAREAFEAVDGVTSVDALDGGSVLRLSVAGSHDAVIRTAAGFGVKTVRAHEADLDEVFLSYYSGDG